MNDAQIAGPVPLIHGDTAQQTTFIAPEDMESSPNQELLDAAVFLGNASAQLTVMANAITDAAQGVSVDLTPANIRGMIEAINQRMATCEERAQAVLMELHKLIA